MMEGKTIAMGSTVELCVPVCFDGGSLRREKAAAKMAAYRQLMEQE